MIFFFNFSQVSHYCHTSQIGGTGSIGTGVIWGNIGINSMNHDIVNRNSPDSLPPSGPGSYRSRFPYQKRRSLDCKIHRHSPSWPQTPHHMPLMEDPCIAIAIPTARILPLPISRHGYFSSQPIISFARFTQRFKAQLSAQFPHSTQASHRPLLPCSSHEERLDPSTVLLASSSDSGFHCKNSLGRTITAVRTGRHTVGIDHIISETEGFCSTV